MEPWPFSHGNQEHAVQDPPVLIVPSMEPWPFSHGNDSGGFVLWVDDTILQWSHGPSAMETADFQDFPPKWCRSRLRFQGSMYVSLLNCQFSPCSSTFPANNCASASPLMSTAPDLSHSAGDRNCPSLAQSATYRSDDQCLPLPRLGLAAQCTH